MKTNRLFMLALLANNTSAGQSPSFAHLQANNIRARFYAHGLIGKDTITGDADFSVPYGANTHALYAAALWIAGLDANDSIHLAQLKYDQEFPLDYSPGPLTTDGTASISSATSATWDQVWSVNSVDVAMHHAYCACLNDPGCDVAVEFPGGYFIPPYFATWPAIGDIGALQAQYLAPFSDFDGDGDYDPANCDNPCIMGDQALFFIFNDKLTAHSTTGLPIGVEIHAMPYAYVGRGPALDQTIFIKYRIINRGTTELHDTYIGFFNDFDIGNSSDDYVGTDVARNLWYGYNGDSLDQTSGSAIGYGAQPPAFGSALLQGPPMDANGIDDPLVNSLPSYTGQGFANTTIDDERLGIIWTRYYNNASGATGDPGYNSYDFYGYMTDLWRDSEPMYYGGSGHFPTDDPLQDLPCHFAFPNDTDPLGIGTGGVPQVPWKEGYGITAPGDRRMIGSAGPFTLEPGADFELTYAMVYARATSGGPFASVAALQQRADSVRAFFNSIGSGCSGANSLVGMTAYDAATNLFTCFPSPTTDLLHLHIPANVAIGQVRIFDATGRVVQYATVRSETSALDVSALSLGRYLVLLQHAEGVARTSFVKQ